jgi:glycosyltransferase involved in cell wall biosynthesis
MRKLYYLGLESYEGRYTLQLQQWSESAFKKRGIDYVVVPGSNLDNSKAIVTGQVLDAHGRSFYSLTQMANLVQMMKNGEVTSDDVIFFEDMFTPGIEALPYIMDQVPANMRPKIWVRCLAQTIDPDDFVHVWGMYDWMSKYEHLVNDFATGILCTNEEMVAHAKIAGWKAPLYNISGLAFGKEEVQSRCPNRLHFSDRKDRVCFAARVAQEKQPWFFLELAKMFPSVEFAFLSGGPLKSNDPDIIDQIYFHGSKYDNIQVYDNLKKDQYYQILADSKVLFNCALQDWVSNTVSEADALGTNVLYPAYRSFPEVFANDYTRMYVPWSVEDAALKLMKLLAAPHPSIGKISDWNDGTIDRCIDIMTGNGEEWLREAKYYRNQVSVPKY